MEKSPLIAVVGMDGIFPGSPDLDTFWKNIVQGIDQSAPVPENRWISSFSDRLRSVLTPDHTYSSHACLINGFSFDPHLFSLDANLTQHLDPGHQLTLTAGKRAVERCMTAPVDPNRVDVILAAIALPTDSASAFSRKIMGRAIENHLFPNRLDSKETISRHQAFASRVDGFPAALLAAEMGFGGDSFTLDAACASSMYALKLSCDALNADRADMVVTGGVSRPECLYTQTGFSQLQALSPSGRCSPFDRNADGLVVGEGVGILVLKRLSDALDHGDIIHGVIHGIGLSNDMRGNLLAPETKGQVRAMQQAYRIAGWKPSDVDLIECHGTGTRAGDTTEIKSLVKLWEKERHIENSCAIGSVKSMIGHLLTAAGAAGMIKTLLAIGHQTLPPTIHFDAPPKNSPLEGSPFVVQNQPGVWKERSSHCPRRAAVSAFGFGGINAHVLFEQWQVPEKTDLNIESGTISIQKRPDELKPCPIAIVGMETTVGALKRLKNFEQAVFSGKSAITHRPSDRWKRADRTLVNQMDGFDPQGAYMDEITINIGDFQILPSEINDILPQQLLALKVGASALVDAGLPLRQPRERMGVVFGIEFDFEATNFNLRWQMAGAAKKWNSENTLGLDEIHMDLWLERLRDQCSPPLTPSRVMGALGGIVASRLAREFRFGGPSFVVSANAASGIKALRVAVDLLCQNAVDAMLVGAVDLAGEGRNVIRMDRLSSISRNNQVRPFDASADGTLPGDGAVAMVLKRLDQAKADNDRVYAVIHGIGGAGGTDPTKNSLDESVYCRSLNRCLSKSRLKADKISFVETHGSGIPNLDRIEMSALSDFFSRYIPDDPESAIALGSTTPISGYTGAAHGLLSVLKTALCLYHRRLPPLVGFEVSNFSFMDSNRFHVPNRLQPWYRNREAGPQTAVSACVTMDGTCSHVLLQVDEKEDLQKKKAPDPLSFESQAGLFVVTGNSEAQLKEGLSELERSLSSTLDQVSVDTAAARWQEAFPPEKTEKLAIALILRSGENHLDLIRQGQTAIESEGSDFKSGNVFYKKNPMGAKTKVAMVYPGSGNHYLGMGRDLALRFPDIIDRMDRDTARLKSQFRPWHLMPWRKDWRNSWELDSLSNLKFDPLNMIFGQVVFGSLMTHVLNRFLLRADAVIGYSLGESAALFAHGIWKDRGDMLARMQDTDLFTNQLAGPCTALRQSWKLPFSNPVQWTVAVVNRPAETVLKAIDHIPHARLLIINTPDECVIGGLKPSIKQAISKLGCQAVFLDGVVTVHCDAAQPVSEAYRNLHYFPVTAKPELAVYSCSWEKSYSISSDKIADSIKKQAVDGFNFTQTIKQAATDGIGVFIEVGPRASCTRMIDRILQDQPHLAVAANRGDENEMLSLFRSLAKLSAERVPVDLRTLYSHIDTSPPDTAVTRSLKVKVSVGGQAISPTLPKPIRAMKKQTEPPPPPATDTSIADSWKALLESGKKNVAQTAEAHKRFLELSGEMTRTFAQTFDLQNRLLQKGARPKGRPQQPTVPVAPANPIQERPVAFDRDKCMAFAVGRVGDVLGETFDVVDTHKVRVRLPDEPLMLVDRIISVHGEMLSLGSGKVVTEHDVLPGAWYLDGNRAPVCISVEAGQADLFLCSYLGIDHQVKGERTYRLLDAVVTFHRGLPQAGETIRYEIEIDRFVRQGET